MAGCGQENPPLCEPQGSSAKSIGPLGGILLMMQQYQESLFHSSSTLSKCNKPNQSLSLRLFPCCNFPVHRLRLRSVTLNFWVTSEPLQIPMIHVNVDVFTSRKKGTGRAFLHCATWRIRFCSHRLPCGLWISNWNERWCYSSSIWCSGAWCWLRSPFIDLMMKANFTAFELHAMSSDLLFKRLLSSNGKLFLRESRAVNECADECTSLKLLCDSY